jgi:hypothetical protein
MDHEALMHQACIANNLEHACMKQAKKGKLNTCKIIQEGKEEKIIWN